MRFSKARWQNLHFGHKYATGLRKSSRKDSGMLADSQLNMKAVESAPLEVFRRCADMVFCDMG